VWVAAETANPKRNTDGGVKLVIVSGGNLKLMFLCGSQSEAAMIYKGALCA